MWRGCFAAAMLLIVPVSQAHPVRLFDVALRSPTLSAPTSVATGTTEHPLAGITALEGLASVGTNLAMLSPAVVAGVLVAASERNSRCEFCGLATGVAVLGVGGLMSLAAPFVTSLVVWAIDRSIPGTASYWKVVMYSGIARVLTVLAGLALGGGYGAVIGVALTPITGMVGELLAVRLDAQSSPPPKLTVLAF